VLTFFSLEIINNKIYKCCGEYYEYVDLKYWVRLGLTKFIIRSRIWRHVRNYDNIVWESVMRLLVVESRMSGKAW